VALTLASLAAIALGPIASAREAEPLLAFYAAQRERLLAAAFLSALAWTGAFLVYLAALHQMLRARGDETTALLARVGFTGGLGSATAIGLAVFLGALAAWRTQDAGTLLLLRDASFLANSFTGIATAVCVLAFSPALRRVGLPRWLVALGVAVGAHHLASAAALGSQGAWSPYGAVSLGAPLGMTLWVGCVAWLAWLRRDRL
jgi:hypothetical protein